MTESVVIALIAGFSLVAATAIVFAATALTDGNPSLLDILVRRWVARLAAREAHEKVCPRTTDKPRGQ